MKYSDKLVEILKEKDFKSFWHCIDYLLSAGYNPLDVFGITLQYFTEAEMFTKVAFIYIHKKLQYISRPEYEFAEGIGLRHTDIGMSMNKPSDVYRLRIGLLDDTNIHLSGFYELYRNTLYDTPSEDSIIKEIEKTAEVIELVDVSELICNYINQAHTKHFGKKLTMLTLSKINALLESERQQQLARRY